MPRKAREEAAAGRDVMNGFMLRFFRFRETRSTAHETAGREERTYVFTIINHFSKITISVRLFKRRPISVSFVAMGRDFPKPSVWMRCAATVR